MSGCEMENHSDLDEREAVYKRRLDKINEQLVQANLKIVDASEHRTDILHARQDTFARIATIEHLKAVQAAAAKPNLWSRKIRLIEMNSYSDSQGRPVTVNIFGVNQQKVLDSSLQTIGLQNDVIQDLLKATQRLTEGLTEANEEIKASKAKNDQMLGTLDANR